MVPEYAINNPDEIPSPAYVIFRPLLVRNIETMCRMAGSVSRLRPHCKTHKMAAVAQLKMDRGITKFKVATIAEAEMVADVGAGDIFVAYNMVGPNIHRIVSLAGKHPRAQFHVTADDARQASLLSAAAASAGVKIGVLLDINPGRDRTGLVPGEAALELYRHISRLPGLQAAGFHLYDGHQRQSNLADRREAVGAVWRRVKEFQGELERMGLVVPRIVCGGTPTFPVYAAIEDPVIELSPGTCVFHDCSYNQSFPDLNAFTPAALVFTRVISRPTANRVTFDLGSKTIASDPPMGSRAQLLGLSNGVQVLQNEEHLVVETPDAGNFQPGDWTLAIPTHVCPTSALYREAIVIDNGQIVDRWAVTSRDRKLTV